MKDVLLKKDTKTLVDTNSMKEVELIAAILGSGSKKDRELAKSIFQKSKGNLLNITSEKLRKVKGIEKLKADRIIAAIKLIKMLTSQSYPQIYNRYMSVNESTVQYSLFGPLYGEKQEVPLKYVDRKITVRRYTPPNGYFYIQQRRYIGNKFALLDFIRNIIRENIGEYTSVCDVFAGTGVVGYYLNRRNTKIISNELLYSNYLALYSFLSPEPYEEKKVTDALKYLNSLHPQDDNYVSQNFGNRYFTMENARKIGAIREEIEKLDHSLKEKAILITSLLYAMDKVANTVGHYDAYREKMDMIKPLYLFMPYIEQKRNEDNEIYNLDANKLIRKINGDILYIDPPYNSRQYSDAYHLLENIARWEKPPLYGKAKKFNRGKLKSHYNLKSAPNAFRDLIENARFKHILFSYNNMGNKGNQRSNARISDEQIINILSSRGEVTIFERKFKPFTTGRSKIENHTERIFWCDVRD
ncbi:MAG: DNA adenine methylase [candidate division WOR-3 bacterium]|nr:DNA adenine methylase [candidate division WOR-3 bacterium]